MPDASLDPRQLPTAVQALGERLRAVGARLWLVGGAVRDHALGLPCRDFDLATAALPEQVAACLDHANLRDARLGVVQGTVAEQQLTITTLRQESDYADARHPDRVAFVQDLALDAARRDFTVNALYLDVQDGHLADPTGGLADLQQRRLRMVGDPQVRLAQDPLRLLRAVRYAARLGGTLDAALARALAEQSPLARKVSAERQFDELTRMFCSVNRGRALHLLVNTGLAAVVLPEVAAMAGVTQSPQHHPEGDVLTHTALVLDHVPPDDAVLAWTAVLHDIGKPPTWRLAEDRIRFDGHDRLSESMAEQVLVRLHASRELRAAVGELCRDHIKFAALPLMRRARRERWLRAPRFGQHLAFHYADCMGSHQDLRIFHFATAELAALPPLRPLPIAGADVLALGVPPSPRVGQLLARVEDGLVEGALAWDRATALALLAQLVQQRD